jgi:hypothetical protein
VGGAGGSRLWRFDGGAACASDALSDGVGGGLTIAAGRTLPRPFSRGRFRRDGATMGTANSATNTAPDRISSAIVANLAAAQAPARRLDTAGRGRRSSAPPSRARIQVRRGSR